MKNVGGAKDLLGRSQLKIKETLAVLERWKSDDQLFILLSPPFRLTMEVDRVVMGEVLTQSALSPEDFRAASDEIGLILLNVLNGTECVVTSSVPEVSTAPTMRTRKPRRRGSGVGPGLRR